MSRLTAKAADMSSRAAVAAQRSRRAAEAARRSCRAAAAWENFSRAGEDSYRRMHAIVHSQMDQISGWMKLQDELNASFEQLRAERDLLRAKIAGRAEQAEETAALLKRTGVIVKKLMDENAMLRIERNRLVEESMDAAKQRIKDMKLMKEIIARREN